MLAELTVLCSVTVCVCVCVMWREMDLSVQRRVCGFTSQPFAFFGVD